ncbi:MAG: methionine adenosyltransferase [Candidatus Baldrarchaeia archaeon]
MKKIVVNKMNATPIEDQPVEMVERKGLGHPDSICDGVVEQLSVNLSKYYLENYGQILHHNVDKGSLAGGRSEPRFGGGEVLEPIYLLVIGRATTEVIKDNKIERIPIGTIALTSVQQYLKKSFRFLDISKHVQIDYKIRPGSQDLTELFKDPSKVPLSNDTSFGVSFAPLSETEKLVLETEQYLNSPKLKKELPEVGEDIKVMGLRYNNKIRLTIAAAIISSLTYDLDHYINVKQEIANRILDLASKITEKEVEVFVNTADKMDRDNPRVYITVTGTSAESGDDGQVGRGNRVNGLITPMRPMSLEAAAGKNPRSHVGKIYNILAKNIADRIIKEVKGVKEVYIRILSQIGKPITDPQLANAQVLLEENAHWNVIKSDIESILETEVTNVTKLTRKIIEGEFQVF